MSSGSCSTSSAAAATGTSPPVLITSAVQSRQPQKTLNCLLCLTPVKDYSLSRLYRKVLRSTSQRMFEYICSFLDIEVTDYYLSRNRCDNRSNNKDAKLLPGNFPLCQKCRESYYGDLYQEFVQYETVVANLSEKISKYVTKPIAISADADGEKAPGQDEHEMMSSVRKVREKVLEKNLMGFAEKSGEVTERPEAGADNCSEMDDRTANLDSEPSPDVETVTPSVSVKPAPECVEILSSSESESNSASSESENDDDLTTNQGDFSYMVKKPAPGVIHIIPALSMRDSSTPVPMRIRSTAAQGAILKPKKRPQPPQFAVIETYDGNSQKVEEKRIRVITKRRGKTRQDNLRLCKFCNQSFPTIAALTKHEVTVHGKLKPEKCEKCEYRAITKPELRAHMEKHLDPSQRVKPFQCSECGARFITNNKLLAHMRTHTGEKPYVCEICGKSFSCKESMKLCVDKHNGVTHHECPWCQKRCLRKEVMAIHMRTHTGEKPFVCQICDKRFAQRAALRVHLKVHNK